MDNTRKDMITPGSKRGTFTSRPLPERSNGQTGKLPAQAPVAANFIEDELSRLRAARAEVQRIRLSAQRELGLAKQMRAEAERYQQETGTKARSQAQMLILQARLAIKKELVELRREINGETYKILDTIRTTANTYLDSERRFTDAARIRALSFAHQEESREIAEKEEEAISV